MPSFAESPVYSGAIVSNPTEQLAYRVCSLKASEPVFKSWWKLYRDFGRVPTESEWRVHIKQRLGWRLVAFFKWVDADDHLAALFAISLSLVPVLVDPLSLWKPYVQPPPRVDGVMPPPTEPIELKADALPSLIEPIESETKARVRVPLPLPLPLPFLEPIIEMEIEAKVAPPLLAEIDLTSQSTKSERPSPSLLSRLRLLGYGTFGSVYSLRSRPTIAMKVFTRHDNALSNFIREVSALRLLDNQHPHIVPLLGVHFSPLPRTQLRLFFPTLLPLPWEANKQLFSFIEVHQIARQLLSAVAFMHARHLTHRDIKPANLLITHRRADHQDIDIVLADMGSCRLSFHPTGFDDDYKIEGILAKENENENKREEQEWLTAALATKTSSCSSRRQQGSTSSSSSAATSSLPEKDCSSSSSTRVKSAAPSSPSENNSCHCLRRSSRLNKATELRSTVKVTTRYYNSPEYLAALIDYREPHVLSCFTTCSPFALDLWSVGMSLLDLLGFCFHGSDDLEQLLWTYQLGGGTLSLKTTTASASSETSWASTWPGLLPTVLERIHQADTTTCSTHLQSVLSALLRMDPEQRLTAATCLSMLPPSLHVPSLVVDRIPDNVKDHKKNSRLTRSLQNASAWKRWVRYILFQEWQYYALPLSTLFLAIKLLDSYCMATGKLNHSQHPLPSSSEIQCLLSSVVFVASVGTSYHYIDILDHLGSRPHDRAAYEAQVQHVLEILDYHVVFPTPIDFIKTTWSPAATRDVIRILWVATLTRDNWNASPQEWTAWAYDWVQSHPSLVGELQSFADITLLAFASNDEASTDDMDKWMFWQSLSAIVFSKAEERSFDLLLVPPSQ